MDASRPCPSSIRSSECQVCNGTASGLHYGVMTCEGCKVFYKRFMGKHQNYRCQFDNCCVINRKTRSRCKACRFKKCLDQGMSVEAIRLGRTPRICRPAIVDLDLSTRNFGDPEVAGSGRPSVIMRASTSDNVSDLNWLYGYGEDVNSGVLSSNRAEFERSMDTMEHSSHDVSHDNQLVSRVTGDSPLQTSFSDENLSYMLSEFLSEFVRPCRLPNAPMPWSRTVQPITKLSTVQKYWGVNRVLCKVLEDSVRTVMDGIDTVFSDQIRLFRAFVHKCYVQGLVPFQPECTWEQMVGYMRGNIADMAERLFQFAQLLPGFTDIDGRDRERLLQDHWLAAWLIMWSFCYFGNECYVPMGPYGVHYGAYWQSQVSDRQLIRFLFSVTSDLNQLKLNLTETSLLMVVSLFRLDSEDNVVEKDLVDFLYTHYLDALVHLIGHGRGDLLTRLLLVIKRFSIINAVHRRYVLEGRLGHGRLGADGVAITIARDPDTFARTDFRPTTF